MVFRELVERTYYIFSKDQSIHQFWYKSTHVKNPWVIIFQRQMFVHFQNGFGILHKFKPSTISKKIFLIAWNYTLYSIPLPKLTMKNLITALEIQHFIIVFAKGSSYQKWEDKVSRFEIIKCIVLLLQNIHAQPSLNTYHSVGSSVWTNHLNAIYNDQAEQATVTGWRL